MEEPRQRHDKQFIVAGITLHVTKETQWRPYQANQLVWFAMTALYAKPPSGIVASRPQSRPLDKTLLGNPGPFAMASPTILRIWLPMLALMYGLLKSQRES